MMRIDHPFMILEEIPTDVMLIFLVVLLLADLVVMQGEQPGLKRFEFLTFGVLLGVNIRFGLRKTRLGQVLVILGHVRVALVVVKHGYLFEHSHLQVLPLLNHSKLQRCLQHLDRSIRLVQRLFNLSLHHDTRNDVLIEIYPPGVILAVLQTVQRFL